MTDQVGEQGGGGDIAVSRHPVADFAGRLRGRLDQLVTSPVPTWSMSTDEKRQTLLDLAVAQAQLDAVRMQVLCDAERDGAVADAGDRTAAEWVARHTQQTRQSARSDLRLATSLDTDHPLLGAALAAGTVNLAQARAIKRSLDLLPRSGEFATTAEQRTMAEEHLVELAGAYDARALEILGRKVYVVICPDHADAYEGKLLEAEEARAARKVLLELWEDHQGTCHGSFRIPKLHGHMLKKMLEAITSPVRVPVSSPDDDRDTDAPGETVRGVEADTRPIAVRRGEALCELIERTCAGDLPSAGGGDATIVVTITLDDLLGRLREAGVATLDTGARISAGEARRLACAHGVLPAVLGSDSEVLDLGREVRLFRKKQRLALSIAQGGCTAEHCAIPAAMCHAHHDAPWAAGGRTDLANGRLLCGPHHRRVHDPAYWHETLPDGRVRFHRRT